MWSFVKNTILTVNKIISFRSGNRLEHWLVTLSIEFERFVIAQQTREVCDVSSLVLIFPLLLSFSLFAPALLNTFEVSFNLFICNEFFATKLNCTWLLVQIL